MRSVSSIGIAELSKPRDVALDGVGNLLGRETTGRVAVNAARIVVFTGVQGVLGFRLVQRRADDEVGRSGVERQSVAKVGYAAGVERFCHECCGTFVLGLVAQGLGTIGVGRVQLGGDVLEGFGEVAKPGKACRTKFSKAVSFWIAGEANPYPSLAAWKCSERTEWSKRPLRRSAFGRAGMKSPSTEGP